MVSLLVFWKDTLHANLGKYVMSQWAAEITNNPDKDYELYVELLEDDEYRARIENIFSRAACTEKSTTPNKMFPCPVDWLAAKLS